MKRFKFQIAKKDLDLNIAAASSFALIDAYVVSNPYAALLWGLVKGLYGAYTQTRQDRTLKFLKATLSHANINEDFIRSTQFQDGMFFTFEKYLFERNATKREMILNVFMGYISNSCSDEFKLEKYMHIISLLSLQEAEVLTIFIDGSIYKWLKDQSIFTEEQLIIESQRALNVHQLGKLILSNMKGLHEFENEEYFYEFFASLVNLGLITQAIDGMGVVSNSYKLSKFGEDFIKYVRN